jgi:AcrR family transcriptional regulator
MIEKKLAYKRDSHGQYSANGQVDDLKNIFGIAKSNKGARTVASILDASLNVFTDQGYAKFTLARVAKRAGIKTGTLCYYFPKKNDLVIATINHFFEILDGRSRELIDSSDLSPLEQFLKITDYQFRVNIEANDAAYWELWAFCARNRDAQSVQNKWYGQWLKLFTNLLLKIRPDLDRPQSNRLAAVIISLIDGSFIFLGKSRPKKIELVGLTATLQESILKIVGVDSR